MTVKPIHMIALVLALAILLAIFLVPRALSTQEAQTQKRYAIRLGLSPQITNTLLIIALDQGYLASEGLNVTVVPYTSGVRALNDGLFQGQADFTTAPDLPSTMALLAQKPGILVATINSTDNANRIVARRDAGITKVEDLRGKRIATQKASAVHFFLHRFLLQHDIAPQDVKLSFMLAEHLPSALFKGEIDAFSMREPYISQAKKLLGEQAVVFAAPGIYEQTDMLIIHHAYLQAHPEVIRPLLRALLKAETFIAEHADEAMAIVAHRMKIPLPEVVSTWPSMSFQIGFQQSTLLLMESQARWAITQGLAPTAQMPNLLDALRIDTLRELKPLTVSVIH